MTTTDQLMKVLKKASLLNADGSLKRLDSIGLIDLVVQLEREFKVTIPPKEIDLRQMSSIDGLTRLIERLRQAAPR